MNSALRKQDSRVQWLDDRHRSELTALIDRDPVANSVVRARLTCVSTLDSPAFGGAVVGVHDHGGELLAAVFHGGNLLPIGGDRPSWRALGAELRTLPRVCTSIVGRADAVRTLWDELGPAWGPARAIRTRQPLLVLEDAASLPSGDRRVRAMSAADIDAYLPSAVAMFTEELGISPDTNASGGDYRRRVGGLVAAGRAFGIVADDGRVVFKADIGAVSPHSCQIQGVWVSPELRGRGLGTAALATVMRHALALAPTVGLYVNDFNVAARRMYRRLGMREVGTFRTVLF